MSLNDYVLIVFSNILTSEIIYLIAHADVAISTHGDQPDVSAIGLSTSKI